MAMHFTKLWSAIKISQSFPTHPQKNEYHLVLVLKVLDKNFSTTGATANRSSVMSYPLALARFL